MNKSTSAHFSIMELKDQRAGRNKDTTINRRYIESGEFRRKFDQITDDPKYNRKLYQLAKDMLYHRSGTVFEDMYWMDLDTGNIIAAEISDNTERGISYSDVTKKKIRQYPNLITIHSHPSGMPPSPGDFKANYVYKYSLGVVVGHNGKVYVYKTLKDYEVKYGEMLIANYKEKMYNEEEAQLAALYELEKDGYIAIKEVI